MLSAGNVQIFSKSFKNTCCFKIIVLRKKANLKLSRVLVAMSGGVDSSFAVSVLQNQGFDCTGVTMILCDEKAGDGGEDVFYAKQVTNLLNCGHLTLNYVDEFEKEVVSCFASAYEIGFTPSPCVWCNRKFKFGRLLSYAISNKFDYLATGHYACVEFSKSKGRYILKKAIDCKKDQTYFLYFLKQEQLSRVLFPLGKFKKSQIKKQANDKGFLTAKRAESQDICFVNGMHYSDFIRSFTKKNYCSGNFVDESGKILGEHRGIINYTVGQRKGLGLALKEPMYVKKIDVKANEVVLANRKSLLVDKIWLKNVNLISVDDFKGRLPVTVKLRYTTSEYDAFVRLEGLGYAVVYLQQAQILPARGQAVVFYDSDVVVGGGEVA